MQFTWSDGRKLTHAQLDSKRTLDIQYNASGLIYKKTMTEAMGAHGDSIYREVTEYYYSGSALMSFKVSKYLDTSMYESNTAWLLYDETGDLIGIKCGGVNYYDLRMEKRVVSRSEMEPNAIWATNRFPAACVASRWKR